jgi:hypothetical protein
MLKKAEEAYEPKFKEDFCKNVLPYFIRWRAHKHRENKQIGSNLSASA